jgi:mono/diheme cytochrome c family protein
VIWAAAIGLAALTAAAAAIAVGADRRSAPLDRAGGQPGDQPAAAPAAVAGAPALPPGWSARYIARGAGPAAAPPVVAHSPNAAFALKPGESIYPGVAPADFEATYEADVRIVEAGRYRFGAEAQGGAVRISVRWPKGPAPLTLSGDRPDARSAAEPVFTDWASIPAGVATVRYTFVRAGDAPARLRALWEMERAAAAGFVAEPIPPRSASVPSPDAPAVGEALLAQGGRSLLGVMGCVNCHDAGPRGRDYTHHVTGPVLAGVGARIHHDWMRRWIAAPQKVGALSFMPNLFADTEPDRRDIEAITHFLVSLGGPAPHAAAATEEKTLEMGRDLFHSVGCVACHGPLETRRKDAKYDPLLPYGDLAGKYTPAALAEFLHDPAATHPRGGMPSLLLTYAEADLIATYLIHKWGPAPAPPPFEVDPAKAAAGAVAFAARGCAACHEAPASGSGASTIVSTLKAPSLARCRPGRGCLDPNDLATPRYTFLPGMREALDAAVAGAAAWTAGDAPAPIDACVRTVEAFGCTRCHEYNGTGGVAGAIKQHFKTLVEADLGDEGRIPPGLTGVGGKLNTSWLKAVLLDAGRARPYMAARMPQFPPAHIEGLAEAFAAADGVWPNSDRREPRASQELVQAGRRLVGDTGLNCISCHVFGASPPTGTPGPAITAFAERIRYDWFSRFVLNPQRFKPETRMTNFFVTGGSAVTEVFGGNGPRQADAMWAYFTLGEFMPAPAGIQQAQGLQVRVGDRPRVIRTFLRHAGSRGIAVGFPEAMGGVHFAFDAESCRLVEAWAGPFLDAAGAWAGRGGEIVGGQGRVIWTAPKGWPLVVGPVPDAWPTSRPRENGFRFRGYTIDDRGVPTFMYDLPKPEQLDRPPTVRERFEPVRAVSEEASPGLRRRIEVDGLNPQTPIWYNAGTARCTITVSTGAALQTARFESGETWYGVAPSAGPSATLPVWFVVEVTP